MATVISSYRDLLVWQKAMDLAVAVYEFTKGFPASEMYGLTSQTRRAAVSVAANIAEGYGRDSTGSYVNFLRTSQGSLKEVETHVLLAARVGLAEQDDAAPLLNNCDEIGKMLRALIRSVERTAGEA
jgi:four helix bundle protein